MMNLVQGELRYGFYSSQTLSTNNTKIIKALATVRTLDPAQLPPDRLPTLYIGSRYTYLTFQNMRLPSWPVRKRSSSPEGTEKGLHCWDKSSSRSMLLSNGKYPPCIRAGHGSQSKGNILSVSRIARRSSSRRSSSASITGRKDCENLQKDKDCSDEFKTLSRVQ